MEGRLLAMMGVFMLCLLIIVIRLLYLSVVKNSDYNIKSLARQSYTNQEVSYRRGDILDTNGNTLATSKRLYNVILEPKNIIGERKKANKKTQNEKLVCSALKKYLNLTEAKIEEILKNKSSYYYPLMGNIPESEIEGLLDYLNTDEGKRLQGIRIDEFYKRVYPGNTLACHAIGFVGDGQKGVGGLEQYYNSTLTGINGRRYTYLNENMEYDTVIENAQDGKSIVSTLDVKIQKITEKYLNRFQKKYGSKNTSVLVMNPNNGEVLGMANSKTYDLENPSSKKNLQKYYSKSEISKMTNKEYSEALSSIWSNYTVSTTYEPGSTFKPFTVAMGLENGNLTGDEYFTCDGGKAFGNSYIRCSHVHGTIPLSDTIALSCNDAMMQIGESLTSSVFYKYQKAFGFGSKTGIDLPGEASASNVLHGEDMEPIDVATSSFGQSFQCTMIQLASAFCSLVNGGYYYEPHMVKQILDSDGTVDQNISKKLVKKTVSEETSEKLKSYMLDTVEKGTAKIAKIKQYDIGGKTGTAEKYPRGTDKRLVSFIGFAPEDDPQLVVYVTIDEIQTGSQSNTGLAVEMTRDILKDSLKYLGVQTNAQKAKANEN